MRAVESAEPAADWVFAVEVIESPFVWLRSLAVLALRVLSLGAGPSNPGGRRAVVRSRSSGEVIAEIVERFGDDESDVDGVIADHTWLSARAFVARWVP